jgi:hypothetical protein
MWLTAWYCVIRPYRFLLLGNPRVYRLDITGPPCVTHLMTLSQQLLQTEQENVGDFETKKGKAFFLHLWTEFYHAYVKMLFHDS